jgi:hypothetical protein
VAGWVRAWDAHAVGAEVTQAQDALAIGDYDHGRLLDGPVVDDLRHGATVLDGDVEAAGALEDVPVLLAGLAHRGRVCSRMGVSGERKFRLPQPQLYLRIVVALTDEWHHRVDVVHDDTVK